MIAVVFVCMIVHPATIVVAYVRNDDEEGSWEQ
jgi:hypothetical protein